MQIPTQNIVPDPAHVKERTRQKRPDRARRNIRSLSMIRPIVVSPDSARPDRYRLVVGERRWREAVASGEASIDCAVREDLTEQEARELQLSESYHHEAVPPMEMGRAFIRYRQTYGVSQQELARRTGITPGTIHHYESLVRNLAPDLGDKVASGQLTFKEARSIADIDGFARQRELAEPFVTGKLSSVYVEKLVSLAKKSSARPASELIKEVSRRACTDAEGRSEAVSEARGSSTSEPNNLEGRILRLAGELDALQLQAIPEYRRLNLISALRILDSKVESAVTALSRSDSGERVMPRPLIRSVR